MGDGQSLEPINLDWCEFDVFVYDLPCNCTSEWVAKHIWDSAGIFNKWKQPKGRFKRLVSKQLRVRINVNESLWRFLKIRTFMGEKHVMRFTCGKLPNFCYFYGKLDHIFKGFLMSNEVDPLLPGSEMPYGLWLQETSQESWNHLGR